MIIGGLQKTSLIDYPGKVSCVIFFSGCNFDCPYCYNPDLVKGRSSMAMTTNAVYDFLLRRKGFLDGVVLSGGEPTIQNELFSFCETIRQMGYPIKLDTNGSRPQVIHRLIDERLIDYIAMDIKTDPFNYSPIIQKDCNPEHILSSIRIIMDSMIPHEFRTTCVKPLVDAGVILRVSQHIKGSMLYALQRFQNVGVLHPEYFEKYDHHDEDGFISSLKAIAEPWVKQCIVR